MNFHWLSETKGCVFHTNHWDLGRGRPKAATFCWSTIFDFIPTHQKFSSCLNLYVNFITLLIKKVSSNLLWGMQFYTVVKSKVPSDWFWGIQFYTAVKKNFLPICFGVTQYYICTSKKENFFKPALRHTILYSNKEEVHSDLVWGIQFYYSPDIMKWLAKWVDYMRAGVLFVNFIVTGLNNH